MVFSSLFFIFIYLPITLILYYLLGKHLRNTVLLITSFLFYTWGEPIFIILICFSVVINYFIALILARDKINKNKLLLILSLIFNIGYLVYFKYFGMFISTIASVYGWSINIDIPTLPLGISFYTFQAISYIVDVYTCKVKPQKKIHLFAIYIMMFPQLVAGPIINYNDIEEQLQNRNIKYKDIYYGMRRFLCGLAKKVLLANNISLIWYEVKEMPINEISILMAWLGIIAFALQIYFDFSGYSDMAIGLARMFGFNLKENFMYPYISQNISEFWRRWHISLGSWFKNYVYIPLGGSHKGTLLLIRNLFIVWFLTGLWHGASWNFIIWGLYFGILVLIEKLYLLKIISKLPKIIRILYSLFFIINGWVIFEFTTISDIFVYLSSMYGLLGNVFIDEATILILKEYSFLYIICIIVSLPLYLKMKTITNTRYCTIYNLIESIYYCLILFLSTVYIVNSTYSPFIYFRF